MSGRLAKSTHVVLREGAADLRAYGAPAYVVDRMAILAEVSRQNRADGDRLVRALYNGLAEESDLFGNGNPVEGVRE